MDFNGATYHTHLQTFGGGVGRNIAEGIYKLSNNVNLISIVGNDQNGDYLKSLLPKECCRSIVTSQNESTGNFALILDKNGDCKLIVGNTDINNSITSEMIIKNEKLIQNAPVVVFDANLSSDCIGTVLEICGKYEIPAFFEPTDMRKAHIPFQLPKNLWKHIKFITPNIHELNVIASCLNYAGDFPATSLDNDLDREKLLADLKEITVFVNKHIENVIVTLGSIGIIIARKNDSRCVIYDERGKYIPQEKSNQTQLRLYETIKIKEIVNVSGAGDSFASGFIVSMVKGLAEDVCVSVGFEASKCALMSCSPVPSEYFDSTHPCWSQGTTSNKL